MEIEKFYLFNLVSNISIQEKYGPFVITIEPDSLCKFDSLSPTNTLHRHNYYELCLVIEGGGEYLHGFERYDLNKGNLFICNPDVVHEIRLKAPSDPGYCPHLYLVFFIIMIEHSDSPTDLVSHQAEEKIISSFLKSHHIVSLHGSPLFSYLDFLIHHMENGTSNHYAFYNMLKTMAFEGLSLLCQTQPAPVESDQYPSDFNQLLIFIESHLNQSITIQDLANVSYMSPRNIHYLFNKYIHQTPKDYINHRKINLAKLYLRMNYKVSDVALLIGIQDIGQFSRLFKKYCGVSPKAFQTSKLKVSVYE